MDIAISLNDSDYMLFYLRGRWAYRVNIFLNNINFMDLKSNLIIKMCNLSWAERYGIRLIYGKIPSVNIECAINDFLKVDILSVDLFHKFIL